MSDIDPRKEEGPEPVNVEQPLTGEPAAPMRLRAEAPRVTRLSRKVLAGLGLVASVGIGGALIYALQTRDGGRANEELYSTDNRATADGLAGLPRDYTGPVLGPPGDLLAVPSSTRRTGARPGSGMATPTPGLNAEEQRRLQELEAARTARLFASTETRPTSTPTATSPSGTPPANAQLPLPDLTRLGLAPQPATPTAQDRQLAFLNAAADRRTVSPDRVVAPASPNILQGRRGDLGRADYRHPLRSARPDHCSGH